jgi:hypothetical protein
MHMYAYVCMYVYLHTYVIKIKHQGDAESSIPLSTRPTRGDPDDCIKLYYIHYYTFTHSCASYSQTLLHLVYLDLVNRVKIFIATFTLITSMYMQRFETIMHRT